MILLLIGLTCFVAALRVASGSGSRADREDVRGARAAAWFGFVALLTLTQLWIGRDEVDRWRFTLLGLRYRVVEAGGRPLPADVVVGGDEEEADLWAPGAGDAPVLALRPVGDDALRSVSAVPMEDAGAVGLVEEAGAFGSEWRVLGGVGLEVGDTIHLQGPGGSSGLVVGWTAGSTRLFDADIPLPWVRDPELVLVGAAGDVESAVTLPSVQGSPLRRLRGFRPSVFQRTYPLADVLESLEATTQGAGSQPFGPALASFLYFEDGRLHLADLDEEVSVAGAAAGGALTVWTPEEGGARILVAGLSHRDYPEPDLVLPERYGVRPLRSFEVGVSDGWLDVTPGSPEIRSLDRDALEQLDLVGLRDAEGRTVHRIRLVPGRSSLARQAIVFDGVPAGFALAQAVFRLPPETSAGEVGVLAPSGLARWATGRPMALGSGDRRVVVRVDGQGTSAGFWLAHVGLLALVGLLFLRRPMRADVFALALAAGGLACLRSILGVSALVEYPYVQEAQQIGLWVLVLLPWSVVVAGEAARPEAETDLVTFGAWRRWIFHGLYALAVVGVAVVLFAGSPAKQAVLGAVPLGVLGFWLAGRSGWRPWSGMGDRLRSAADARPRLWSGWALGGVLLLARALLEALGWREQITLGGTRIGVSVLYTPAVVAAFTALLHIQAHRVRARAREGRLPEGVAEALVDLGGFLLLALVAVSLWVSDFGVGLVLLPGALTVVALLGFRWAAGASAETPHRQGRAGGRPRPRLARGMAMTLALPLAVFVLFQASPRLLTFAWGGDAGEAEARMGEWNRNELLLLERGDPAALRMIGQRRSEALAVMRQTMRSYTRGNLAGKGFLEGRVSGEIVDTAAREHAVSALLASQFGLPGVMGLVLILAAFVAPVTALVRDRDGSSASRVQPTGAGTLLAAGVAVLVLVSRLLPYPFNVLLVGLLLLAAVVVALGPRLGVRTSWWWGTEDGPDPTPASGEPDPLHRVLALASLYVVAFAGFYMVLANYGLVFFTGKNVYLLGLDSVGDALETLALFGMAALALGMERPPERVDREAVSGRGATGSAVTPASGDGWWHRPEGEVVTR
jgi:hypothetical protein